MYVLDKFILLRWNWMECLLHLIHHTFISSIGVDSTINRAAAMQQPSIRFYREAFGAVEERCSAFRDPSNAKKSFRFERWSGGETKWNIPQSTGEWGKLERALPKSGLPTRCFDWIEIVCSLCSVSTIEINLKNHFIQLAFRRNHTCFSFNVHCSLRVRDGISW